MKNLFAFMLLFFCLQLYGQMPQNIHYKLDSKKTAFKDYSSGFADTFSVYGNKFRVLMIDTATSELALEKFTKSWQIVDSFDFSKDILFPKSNLISKVFDDYNLDGYPDFVVGRRWFDIVFLYEPKKKTFIKSGFYFDEPKKIKGYSNLFTDSWSFKYDSYCDYFFTIKNYKRINLGSILLKVKRPKNGDDNFIPTYISITKFSNDSSKEINRISKTNISKFDKDNYWKNNIRLFYSPKEMLKREPDFNEPDFSVFDPLDE